MTKRSGKGGQCFRASWDYFVSRDQALTPSINRELYLPEHHTFVTRGNVKQNREGSSIAQLKQC